MTDRYIVIENHQPAPEWMCDYVQTLAHLCQHQRPLRVVVAPQTWFDALPGKAEGALMQLADGGDVLIMPDRAVDTGYWHDIIAHEFAHALHSGIDRLVAGKVDAPAYETEVEQLTKLVGGLVQYVALHMRWRRDGVQMITWSKEEMGQ